MIRRQRHTIRRRVKLGRLILLFAAAATVILCSSCEEIPPYAEQPGIAAGYPPGTPPGWWDDEGVSGSPKIVVHIDEQKAYFYKGKHLVGETTVSTGKPGFSTPPGHYQVLSKSPDHVSSVFGDYVDDYGNVVRSNIDARKDRQPPGTHFDGAQMPYAMFFRGGYAMHQGYVPPYAASHGCIRLPRGMARPFFENAPVGTPVSVKE
jgi:lipoprotein-anchoring transpeptidase ErfK/SrfK